MKKKLFTCLMTGILAISSLAGCGSSKNDAIPYPDNYYIPRATETENESVIEETDATSDTDTSTKNAEKTTLKEENETITKNSIHFFLDTSGSMKRSPEVIKVHSAATKCAAGYEDRHFYSIDADRQLTETTEELALSGNYGTGAPLDLIENGTLPYDTDGVNVITTDLQSNTSCSELGRWLVKSGCTGYSFYVFTMEYNGSLEFETYTSSNILETVSIENCSFNDKEFLMVVFGNNALVEDYDNFFQNRISSDVNYDTCHVSLQDDEELPESFLKLTSSKCFDDDVANVDLANTNYVYGLQQIDSKDTEFTCDNTFVYKKSSKSANKAKQAVKAILYATPDEPVPEVENIAVTNVLEYNEESDSYEESEVTFDVEASAFLDGLPSTNEDSESKSYARLNKALGGNIVESGPVFAVTVQNDTLPEGLFAVEVQVTFQATGEVIDLQNFASSHSAGLEEYSSALQNECTANVTDDQTSQSCFTYTGDTDHSVFSKLLEFEKVTDELIAAGAVTESNNKMITIRLIIDNR